MELREIFDLVPQAAEQLPRGAFLTAGGDVWNPMTIGWAQFGVIWGRPVVTVMVRKSRFTFSRMEQTDVFTVSVPRAKELAKELGFCGSRSGRDVDKERESGLTRSPARAGGADGVRECGAAFECRIVQKQMLDLDTLDPEARARYYGSNQALPNGDPHMIYVGEILAAYSL
ncbi:MAG: flavin reductase family protein [Clostridiales bacterium]|nr:flavin reductase family protein [Clostridiales bacterium]